MYPHSQAKAEVNCDYLSDYHEEECKQLFVTTVLCVRAICRVAVE